MITLVLHVILHAQLAPDRSVLIASLVTAMVTSTSQPLTHASRVTPAVPRVWVSGPPTVSLAFLVTFTIQVRLLVSYVTPHV